MDEIHHYLCGRSSYAWAKKAAALRRISFARCSSLFSRSSCLIRSWSENCCTLIGFCWSKYFWYQTRSVSGVQPLRSMLLKEQLRKLLPSSMDNLFRIQSQVEPLYLWFQGYILLFSSGHSLRKVGLRQTRYGSVKSQHQWHNMTWKIIKKTEFGFLSDLLFACFNSSFECFT